MTHCVQKDAEGKPYFGWSIDLNGSHDVYDEPPGSLQLLPFFDFCSPTDEIYRNTVAMIRSPEYKYSFANSPINVDEVTGYCTTGEAFATCAGFLCHSIREALL